MYATTDTIPVTTPHPGKVFNIMAAAQTRTNNGIILFVISSLLIHYSVTGGEDKLCHALADRQSAICGYTNIVDLRQWTYVCDQ